MDNELSKTKVSTDGELSGANLSDYLLILFKWRKLIITNVAIITAAALIVSLLLPKWYKATASILPPKEQDMFSALGAASSVLKNLSPARKLSGLGQNLGAYNYLAILNSRTAMEAVVRRFDLITVYNVSENSMEKAIKGLRDNTSFEVQNDDYITIEVLDKDPQRAAALANYFVEVLNETSIELATREARNNKEFIEKRLEENKSALRRAEDSLRSYQEKTRTFVIQDQNSSSISAVAELYGMKAKKEVELAILRKTVSGNSPLVRQLELELTELGRKLGTFPQIGIESLRLYRDVLIQQKIVEFLVPLYEQARIDEQKNVPVILVLDTAVPPEKKDRPKRLIIVLLWTVIGFSFSVIWVFTRESISRLASYEKAKPIFKELQNSYIFKKIFPHV